MNDTIKTKISDALNIILPVILMLEYISAVIGDYSFVCNLFAVILLLGVYFYYKWNENIYLKDAFFVLCSVALVILANDLTKISILCVFILFNFREFLSKITIKRCFIASLVCMTIIVVAYFFGFNSKYDTEIYRPLQGITVFRRCFGFVHPNQFTIYLLSITIMVYMLTDKFLIYTLITVIDYIFFNYTQSRTVLYVVLFIYVFATVVKFFKLTNIKSRWLMPLIFGLFIVGSVYLSLNFAGTKLDVILTGRLALNKKYLESGVTLLGDKTFDDLPFDNTYTQMLVTNGIIYYCVYNVFMLYKFYNTKFSYKNAVLLLAIMLEGFMEVIFLKYCFMIIIPLLCLNGTSEKYDIKDNSLLLVRQRAKN